MPGFAPKAPRGVALGHQHHLEARPPRKTRVLPIQGKCVLVGRVPRPMAWADESVHLWCASEQSRFKRTNASPNQVTAANAGRTRRFQCERPWSATTVRRTLKTLPLRTRPPQMNVAYHPAVRRDLRN